MTDYFFAPVIDITDPILFANSDVMTVALQLEWLQNITILISFPNKPWFSHVFTCLKYKSFENTVGKGEIARNKQFLLFSHCFLPIWRPFCHFQPIRNCHLQTLSVWKSLKFVVWEMVIQFI